MLKERGGAMAAPCGHVDRRLVDRRAGEGPALLLVIDRAGECDGVSWLTLVQVITMDRAGHTHLSHIIIALRAHHASRR
jgi:hypothetical protein